MKRAARTGDNVGGVDLRRARHITLPAERREFTADSDPTATVATVYRSGDGIFSAVSLGQSIFGVGNAVFTGGLNANMTRRSLLTNYTRVNRLVDFRGSTGALHVYVCGGGTNPDYYRSANGTAWVKGDAIPSSGVVEVHDLIAWDGLLVAYATSGGTAGITASADGVSWEFDDTAEWRWIPNEAVQFLGVSMAPWGASAIYFLDGGRLWVLDFFVHNAVPIRDLGDEASLWTGTVWNGSIWVTDGLSVWEYNPGNSSTVRAVGIFGKDGLPPSWRDNDPPSPYPSDDGSYRIIEFLPGLGTLFAVARRFLDNAGLRPENQWRLLAYNGTGWSWYGPEIAGVPQGGYIQGAGTNEYGPRIVVVSQADADPLDLTLTAHNWTLPISHAAPSVGWKESFEAGPLHFETGWFDGGFVELEGVLLRLTLDGHNLSNTETVLVEYRLNNDEDATYLSLGTFTNNQQVVWFDEEKRGVAFKSVQFRISLDRATALNSDRTKSPELRALILLFDKKPHIRTSWNIRIDMSRTAERGMLLDPETPATVETIWQFLKSLVNTPKLINLQVPSMEPGGVNVRITDLPTTVSEFRTAVGGKQAFVELQLIEVAAR